MGKAKVSYGPDFFASQRAGSLQSGMKIVPIINALLRPGSVIDVGCGVGTWLKVFLDLDLHDVLGVDGDYVDQSTLAIPPHLFRVADLTKPLEIVRTFDLAMSLEVAEHLPPANGPSFIQTLTGLAPCVLFSAAIPYQGGPGHVNEQWQDYWMRLFEEEGFLPIDCVRPRVWNDGDVEWWYKQNLLLYVSKSLLEEREDLQSLAARQSEHPLRLVHPDLFLAACTAPKLGVLAKAFVPALRASLVARTSRPSRRSI